MPVRRIEPVFSKACSSIQEAKLIEVVETIQACRDPKDNKYLEAAVSGGAECIVSGDDDLLVLHPFRRIPILRPRAFLDRPTLSAPVLG
ncbi:MAG: putative toxin-antitoxin system toxin component, PIN family [Rhodothermia bacterium]